MTAGTPRHDAAVARGQDGIAAWTEALLADPRFDAVMVQAIDDMLSCYRDRGWVARIFADRGHTMGGAAAIYLHYVAHHPGDGPGLTAGRFQSLCSAWDFCSQGRAAALLSLMRLARFLEAGEPAGDRRVRLLVPTRKLFEFQWQRWSCFIPGAALALGVPARELVQRMEEAQEPVAVIVRRGGRRFLEGFRLLRHTPELAPMAERDGGLQVLSMVYASVTGGDPAHRMPISVSGIAGSLRISRAQVRKLLQVATEDELLIRTGNADALMPSARLTVALRRFYATLFVFLGDATFDMVQDHMVKRA